MSLNVTIPILDIEISLNTLIATILFLCIFFTFFSVSLELGGNLNPKVAASEDSNCYQDGNDTTLIMQTKLKAGAQKVWDEIKSEIGGSDSLSTHL